MDFVAHPSKAEQIPMLLIHYLTFTANLIFLTLGDHAILFFSELWIMCFLNIFHRWDLGSMCSSDVDWEFILLDCRIFLHFCCAVESLYICLLICFSLSKKKRWGGVDKVCPPHQTCFGHWVVRDHLFLGPGFCEDHVFLLSLAALPLPTLSGVKYPFLTWVSWRKFAALHGYQTGFPPDLD